MPRPPNSPWLDLPNNISGWVQIMNLGTSVSTVSDYRLDDRAIEAWSPAEAKRIFPPASVSRLALGPTQPPVQWVPEALSLGVKRGQGVTLTTQPHLVARYWMRSYTSSPPCSSIGVLWDCVTFTFYKLWSSSLCNLLHSPLTSSLLGPNILLKNPVLKHPQSIRLKKIVCRDLGSIDPGTPNLHLTILKCTSIWQVLYFTAEVPYQKNKARPAPRIYESSVTR
jgi:hypothetical protein